MKFPTLDMRNLVIISGTINAALAINAVVQERMYFAAWFAVSMLACFMLAEYLETSG